jgi:hypothetical protein
MRITRLNGEIIDCTVSEYLLMRSTEEFSEKLDKVFAEKQLEQRLGRIVRSSEKDYSCETKHESYPLRGFDKPVDKPIEDVSESFAQRGVPNKVNKIEVKHRHSRNKPLHKVLNKGAGSGHGKRISSCQPWNKQEDIIILNNDIRTALKLLPNRTYSALKSRLKKFHKGGLRRPQNVKANDYRRTMMKWVTNKAAELQKSGMVHDVALKQAMELYKLQYASQNKRINE